MPKGQCKRYVAQREIFAQAIASGASPEDAARIAKYRDCPSFAGSARKRAGRADVRTRVADIQAETAERNDITRDSLIAQCQRVYELALREKQCAAAISAIKEIGILSGKRIERVEQGEPGDFALIDQLSPDELRAFIAGKLTVEDLRAKGGKLN